MDVPERPSAVGATIVSVRVSLLVVDEDGGAPPDSRGSGAGREGNSCLRRRSNVRRCKACAEYPVDG